MNWDLGIPTCYNSTPKYLSNDIITFSSILFKIYTKDKIQISEGLSKTCKLWKWQIEEINVPSQPDSGT